MKNILSILPETQLFTGLTESEIDKILSCLRAKMIHFSAGDYILRENSLPSDFGIVLTGSIHIIKEDYWGNRDIVSRLSVGDIFCEAFALAEISGLPVSVAADDECDILFIDYKKLSTNCANACNCHAVLLKNLMNALAIKNIQLTAKIQHLSKRTTREKLLSYLSEQAAKAGSNEFDIPFNRQEMADYLSVDRSAMSAELGKLRDEEIVTFNKNHFCLSGNAAY